MEPLVRYTVPTKYDLAPYGTVCVVKGDANEHLFIQLDTGEYSNWVTMGDFLVSIFNHEIRDTATVEMWLRLYKK